MIEFITKLFAETWCAVPGTANAFNAVIRELISNNVNLQNYERDPIKIQASTNAGLFFDIDSMDDITEEETVLMIDVTGVMFREDSWWKYGTESIAAILMQAYSDDNVRGIIMRYNTPGGTTSSVIPLNNALKVRNKPVYSLVDDMAASAGIYCAAPADKIIATDDMCQVGSIGVMTILYNWDKWMKDMGVKEIIIIPPESIDKNAEVLEALKGKPEKYIENILTPWAIHFQDHIKKHRSKLKSDEDRVLKGGLFYAKDAINLGLIDQIASIQDTIQMVLKDANINTVKSIVNS